MITLDEINRLSELSEAEFLEYMEEGRKKMIAEGRKPSNEPSLVIDMTVEEFCRKTGAITFEQFQKELSK